MADTKTSGLTELAETPAAGDLVPVVDVSDTTMAATGTDKKVTYNNLVGGYALQFACLGYNPADDTTYYIGITAGQSPNTTDNRARIYIPKAGNIIRADIVFFNASGNGTAEASTISLRLNSTTDTSLSAAVDNSTNPFIVNKTGLSIAVVAGDYFEIKWVTPAWATNPTGTRISGSVFIK